MSIILRFVLTILIEVIAEGLRSLTPRTYFVIAVVLAALVTFGYFAFGIGLFP